MRTSQDERVTNLETALNALSAGQTGVNVTAPALNAASDPEYTRTFNSYFRRGYS